MPDAIGRPQVRDVYVGRTFGEIEDDTFDQGGIQVTATEADRLRVRRWIKEALEAVQAEIQMDEATQRSMTLTVTAGTSRYALDYDVLEPLRGTDADGVAVRFMRGQEAQDRMTVGDGAWPDSDRTTIIVEEMDASGRVVVRVRPEPAASATYTIWYNPKQAVLDDRDKVLPIPSIFHPAVEAYVKSKLHERQEDQKMVELQLGKFQMAIVRGRSRYAPAGPVQEAFASSYQDRPTSSRAPGRMSDGN